MHFDSTDVFGNEASKAVTVHRTRSSTIKIISNSGPRKGRSQMEKATMTLWEKT